MVGIALNPVENIGMKLNQRLGRHLTPSELRGGRAKTADGFKDVESSDWMFGALFLVFFIFALSPGVLLTIPPGRGGLLMSGNTSTLAAFVHAILLVVLLNFL